MDDYMSQFSVVFGKATSVSRNVITDTKTGDGGSGTVKTTHRTVEQAVIVPDSGPHYPLTIDGVEHPFLYEGGDYALTVRNGVPVVITSIGTGIRHWINGGPEADVRARGTGLLSGILMLVAGALIIGLSDPIAYEFVQFDGHGQFWVILTGSLLVLFGSWMAVRGSKRRNAFEQMVAHRRALRTEFVDGAIKAYRDGTRSAPAE